MTSMCPNLEYLSHVPSLQCAPTHLRYILHKAATMFQKCKSDHATLTLCLLPVLPKIEQKILQWSVRHSLICPPTHSTSNSMSYLLFIHPIFIYASFAAGNCQACLTSGPWHCLTCPFSLHGSLTLPYQSSLSKIGTHTYTEPDNSLSS